MKEGGNLARTIPTSNPDPDQEQGGLGVWCGVNRQRAERSRALGPVRPTSDATRGANAAQPTARRRRQRRRPTHPRNTHERAATSDASHQHHHHELPLPLPWNRRTSPRREDSRGVQCWWSPSGRGNRKGAARPFQAPPTPPASAVESDWLHPHKGGAEASSPNLTADRRGSPWVRHPPKTHRRQRSGLPSPPTRTLAWHEERREQLRRQSPSSRS